MVCNPKARGLEDGHAGGIGGGQQGTSSHSNYAACRQRSRTTIEDFTLSYFPYLGLDPLRDFFRFMDVLVWLEGTVYQLDEMNELLAKEGRLEPRVRLAGKRGQAGAMGRDSGLIPGVRALVNLTCSGFERMPAALRMCSFTRCCRGLQPAACAQEALVA